jgi:integrase
MLLLKALETLQSETVLSKVTKDQYLLAIKRLEVYLRRPPSTADLDSETVNKFLVWLPDEFSIGNTTVRNHRTSIVRLWRFCHDTLKVAPDCPVRRIRRPRVEKPIVRAWTLVELNKLIKAAKDMPGTLRCGVPAKAFMSAWLWTGYDTGMRPSDLRQLRWEHVYIDESLITFVQHKTGGGHNCRFGKDTKRWLKALKKFNFERVFPLCKWGVGRWESILYARAARLYEFDRVKGMGIGTLRKSHATEIYRQHGIAAAAESLGHRSGIKTAMDHYVDARAIRRPIPTSPGTGSRKRA